MLRCILLMVCAFGASAQAQPLDAKYHFGLAARIVHDVFNQSYKYVSEERCGEAIWKMALLALQGESTLEVRKAAVEAECFDTHSAIYAPSTEPHDPMSETEVAFGWSTYPVRYVRLSLFSRAAFGEFKEVVEGLGNERIVLDLRGNPGGSLEVMEDIAELFAPRQGAPMYLMWKRGEVLQRNASARGPLAGRSMLILVDRNTASAGEILTAILKQWGGRHVAVMGERTYGKSSVQGCLMCNDFLHVRVTVGIITVGNWKRHVAIHRVGITPDIYLPDMRSPDGYDTGPASALKYYGIGRGQ